MDCTYDKDVNFVVRGWTVAESIFQKCSKQYFLSHRSSKTLCWHKDANKMVYFPPLEPGWDSVTALIAKMWDAA